MKTKDAYNGSRRWGERFLRLWSELAQGVFPFIMEEVGELDSEHRLFVSVCEAVIDPKEFEYAKWCGNGRPKADRVSMFKAYILKMTLNLKGDKELVELLRQQPLSRRLCGWGSAGLVPSRPSFCRAFAEFAERGFTERCLSSSASRRSISLSHSGKRLGWHAPQRRRKRISRLFRSSSDSFSPLLDTSHSSLPLCNRSAITQHSLLASPNPCSERF